MAQKGHVFILSGGAGTRLWPLSREGLPKQFFDLTRTGQSLLGATVGRLGAFGDVHVLTTKALDKATLGLLKKEKVSAAVIGEPEPKNTAAAVALATWQVLQKDPRGVVGVFPADHAIRKPEAFRKAVTKAFEAAAAGHIVTLGIHPTFPSEAYGYMELESAGFGTDGSSLLGVKRFIEKPKEDKARELIATQRVVWNAGMFVFSAAAMAKAFEKHMPELWSTLGKLSPDLSNIGEIYKRLPSLSIDYGIMEKLTDIKCVPADMEWSDLGSWEEVSRYHEPTEATLQVQGRGNCYIPQMPRAKTAAFVGVDDVVAIDLADTLLVMKRGSGQKVKDVVEILKQRNSPLTKTHEFEERPWGRFEILLDTEYFKSKRILVHPGERLSYQSHAKRAEHWVVVKGLAEVTLNDEVLKLKAGQHVFIPLGAKHRMANPGTEPMEFIEVQTGTYFGEDDIVRYEDVYGRA